MGMKKPDLIKQLANRINQPHVIESWINKIEKAAYNKGYKDAETKQCTIADVVSSLPSKDEKLIENMCISFRHDFGLLPKLIQDDLKRDCKNWLIAYENNRS